MAVLARNNGARSDPIGKNESHMIPDFVKALRERLDQLESNELEKLVSAENPITRGKVQGFKEVRLHLDELARQWIAEEAS
jgi:hypothetical protein